MNFALGLLCGVVIGMVVMNLVHEWLDSQLFKDEEQWLGRLCPPCDGKCKQNRNCPAETRTTQETNLYAKEKRND